MNDFGNVFASLLAIAAFLGLVPFIAVAATAFTKVAIILLIIRNALGIQQTPPNIIIYSIALILSFYIMYPVMSEVYIALQRLTFAGNETQLNIERAISLGGEPLRAFMLRYIEDRDQDFYIETLKQIWPDRTAVVQKNDFAVVVPAFMTAELTKAFQLGFLLYIPFLVIDIVVSAILIALGLQMMSPTIISIPFKLLLFVAIDGWNKLFQGLILSYVPQ